MSSLKLFIAICPRFNRRQVTVVRFNLDIQF
jgi:hypothetical protein